MECSVCEVRSSVGYCVKCERLLCEECGIVCAECQKLVCTEHVYETSSGKSLCPACRKARAERKARRKRGEDEEPESALPPGVEDEEEDEEAQVLVASARAATPPWLLSIYASLAGLVVIALVVFLDAFPVWTAVPAVLVAVAGLAWALYGMVSPEHREERSLCPYGLVLSLVALAGAAYVFKVDADRRAALEQESQLGTREYETDAEREQWRRERLGVGPGAGDMPRRRELE